MTNPTPVPTPAPTPVPVVNPTNLATQIADDLFQLLEEAPAWKTAGFWVAVATMILGVLVTIGVIKPDVAASANVQEIVQLSAGIAAIVIPAAVLAVVELLKKHNLAIRRSVFHAQVSAVVYKALRQAK